MMYDSSVVPILAIVLAVCCVLMFSGNTLTCHVPVVFCENSRNDSEKNSYNNVMRAYHTNVMIQKQHAYNDNRDHAESAQPFNCWMSFYLRKFILTDSLDWVRYTIMPERTFQLHETVLSNSVSNIMLAV